jgi:Uma2 family endonuclease
MVAAPDLSTVEIARPADEQRMLLTNVSWKDYVLMRDLFDGPGVRMTYVNGRLELMTVSPEHELWKTNLARLLELFAYIFVLDLRGYGSTTFKAEAAERGAEPDECYLLGKKLARAPEIVIEVIRTSPLLDKLAVYLALGVQEVWVYRARAITVHVLDAAAGRYVARSSSVLVPTIDLAMVARYVEREDTLQALREFEAEVRAPRS